MSAPSLHDIAIASFKAGWHPLELPSGSKGPPPEGRTGYGGNDMTLAEVEDGGWMGNLGYRMPIDVIGLDVDAYRGGLVEFTALVASCGPLPNTWISHSGRNDNSGIRFYRVPVGLSWVAGRPGIDIIQRGHRYAAVWPSIHPDGRQYGWWDQSEGGPSEEVPLVEDLPELPWPWVEELSRPDAATVHSRAVSESVAAEFIDAHDIAEQPSYIAGILAHFLEQRTAGHSRHDTMQHCLIWGMECVRAGIAAARPTISQLGELWVDAVRPDARRAELWSDRRTTEFEAMLRHAIGKAEAKSQDEIFKLHDDIAGIRFNAPPRPDPVVNGSLFFGWGHNFPPPQPLIDGVLDLGAVTVLYARWGCFKSFLAIDWAMSVATGKDWHGRPVERSGPVAILGYEAPVSIHRRAHAWSKHHGVEPGANYHLAGRGLPRLSNPAAMLDLAAILDELGVVLVVVDTIARGGVGADMNTHEADLVFQGLHTLASPDRTVVGIAHAGKDASRGIRGFSSQEDQADLIYRLDRERDSSTQQPKGPATLSNPKAKDRETIGVMHFDLVHTPKLGLEERVLLPRTGGPPTNAPIPPDVRAEVLVKAAIDQNWWHETVVAEKCKRPGIGRPEIRQAIDRLVELEFLERSGDDPKQVRRREEIEYLDA